MPAPYTRPRPTNQRSHLNTARIPRITNAKSQRHPLDAVDAATG